MQIRLPARPMAAVAAALVGTSVLAACSTGSTAAQDAPEHEQVAEVDEGAFPVTIEHAFGETTIEEEPQRVVTVSWTDQDAVLALGVAPVGAVDLTWGGNEQGSTAWFDAELAGLDADQPERFSYDNGPDTEAIAELAPDVIVAANSGLTKKEYEKLSEIAPTVAYPEKPWVTSWQDSLDIVGKVLGRSSLADQVREETEQTIEAAAEEYPEIQGKSVLFAWLTSADLSQVGLYLPEDNRMRILEELGMEPAPVLDGVAGTDPFYATVSAERAQELESDVLLTYAEGGDTLQTFAGDQLIGEIPALKSGNAYAETDKHLGLAITNPSPLSIPYLIDHFLPHVAEAAEPS